MNRTYSIFLLLCIIINSIFTACSNNDDAQIPNELIGDWIGICHESRGTSYLSVSFNTDLTGELLLESPSGAYNMAYFEYTMSGNEVLCKGTSSGTIGGGGTNNNFSMTFHWDTNRLTPINQYTQFILTKDGSIETDQDGNITTK